MSTKARFNNALSEVGAVLGAVDEQAFEAMCQRLASAKTIGVYGCGREALQMRGFAMRLFHLGLNVGVVGDVTMPPLGLGDVLIVSSGPGELATVNAHIKTAKAAGAEVIFITAEPFAEAAKAATQIVSLPAQTMASDQTTTASTVLPMGSAYEGALFFLFEIVILRLREVLDISQGDMRSRHTNME
ncbi:MAG: 6-phospho-3-hexuloisomerase [Hyphomicrobiales bacterium]|nr:SIS domain-containing protein [Hyphomicrobiales bacterium]PCJ89933.1 MAG: 6-phospho-3-hexuloisomerase [Hyphomicrobiales bacterium]